jgi:hypothetical protein
VPSSFSGKAARRGESCVQALQLRFAHGLQIDAGRLFERLRALNPTQEDFGSAGIIDGTLTETALDIGVRGGLTVSTAGTNCTDHKHARQQGFP